MPYGIEPSKGYGAHIGELTRLFGDSGEDVRRATFTTTITGGTAVNVFEVKVTDSTTISEGYMRGIYVNYTNSGAKTGGECNPLAVDMTMSANSASCYAVSLYICQSDDPTISNDISAIYIYADSKGSATYSATYNCLDLNMDSTAKATGGNNFMRIYGHGAAADNVMTILVVTTFS